MTDTYFNKINEKINQLSLEDKNILNEYLGEMEQEGFHTVKKYLKYIVANYNCILEKTFGTKNKYYLARYCEYIIDVERHNEWAIAVSGRSTPTFFGWFDV